MAKLPQLRAFAGTHGLKMCSIEAILRFLDTGKRTR
jgi:3,4-dihydroxy-2-butanone 4-phosphate synthase